ncbi:DUF1573 domain-containing protein [Flavobacteriaceae bacterium 14752]|uniref:DUF1573 domain-containing protein n=1 Tax=Mesohalobacter salilacus TaxID=2491711 RepID=UPI000F6424C0|nr:DUF1573 domain-containing protein [Flavobacteriaceae bacterium 14752]
MKKLILSLIAISTLSLMSCKDNAADKVKAENVENATERDAQEVVYPTLDFEKKTHDFGTINEGDVVEHTFTFTNNGKAPLVITNARGSCGCTVPSWTKEPIAPGETGEMLVKFNSRGKRNQQNKTVTVTANTQSGKETLQIKTFVTPSANNANAGSPIQVK